MCLAIYKPASTPADWIAYENGHYSNPHSWGFAAVVDGTLVVKHGIGAFTEFRVAFEPYAECQAAIHFRWATHGSKTVANCHPFMVSRDLAMIHNGIIGIECNVHSDRSDTWHFNELVCKPMHEADPAFFGRPCNIYTMEMAHKSSKFVFLHATGEYAIWNERDGDWASDGHWYSNSDHEYSRHWRSSYVWRDNKYTQVSTTTKTTLASAPERGTDPFSLGWSYDESDNLIVGSGITDEAEADDPAVAAAELASAVDHMERWTEDDQANADICVAVNQLRQAGLAESTIADVLENLGQFGLELLIDAI